ncbi:hypothetical protein H257_11362 [Aphanomyces astaci]|uniref:Uncharacterized protein n=1 Tax=Aphanomyces astaci TaxID=112090 RepID=W4G303_APHAT|nr:hypothetical protein H257_11362 [Aphanomyces astaci]ETV74050.1 hypothetical protein H257_11362 [Aphanomyces astaci]|eukprot:XP_009836563.1 hypothetical protein H257_11362 [Aphanomyces astaci]
MIMMAYLEYHHSAYLLNTSKPMSILTGAMWVAEMLDDNEDAFIDTFRMPGATFGVLLTALDITDGRA